MKKIIKGLLIFMLIGSMLFLLTGCGDKEDSKKEDKEDVAEQKQEINAEETEKPEFSMGEWNNNVYTNDFLGLKFNLPEGWSYSSDEEIAEMMNLGVELLNDDQKAAAEISKLSAVYYMVAQSPNKVSNVNILSEKQLTDITTEEYINAVKTQLLSVQSINYEVVGTSEGKIGNIQTNTVTLKANTSGVEIAQKYCVYKIDKYIVCIIATSANGETGINEIMECFE